MTNPKPPYGWRIVDKSKDDPSDFDRIMLFCEGEWKEMKIFAFSEIEWMHYAVPIDPGPDHRLIDQDVDKPEDHSDAEYWMYEVNQWSPRGYPGHPWYANEIYRTPIERAEMMTNEYDVEWFPGVPSEEQVGNSETCWVTVESGTVIDVSGYAARWLERPNSVIAWTHRITPKPYVPPKLPQPGEVWETRDNHRVCVVAKNNKADSVNSGLVGILLEGVYWQTLVWSEEGKFFSHIDCHDRDLVKHLPNEPWPQEIVR